MNDEPTEYTVAVGAKVGAIAGVVIAIIAYFAFFYDQTGFSSLDIFLVPACLFMFPIALVGAAVGFVIGVMIDTAITRWSDRGSS